MGKGPHLSVRVALQMAQQKHPSELQSSHFSLFFSLSIVVNGLKISSDHNLMHPFWNLQGN